MIRPALSLSLALAAVVLSACQSGNVQFSASEAPREISKLAALNTQLGIGYMREGKLEYAWKRLHRALEADPEYSAAHNAMGLLYARLGEPTKAEEHFRRAIEINPVDSAAQTNFGSFLCRAGRYDEGEKRFLQALKNSLYSSPELAYTNAGLCMKNAGDLEKAERYYRSALQLNPRLPSTLASMAEISFVRGHHLPARAYLQRYLEVGRHTANTLWLGIRIERLLGDKNAVSSYAMLLRGSYPDSHEAQLLIESEAQ